MASRNVPRCIIYLCDLLSIRISMSAPLFGVFTIRSLRSNVVAQCWERHCADALLLLMNITLTSPSLSSKHHINCMPFTYLSPLSLN